MKSIWHIDISTYLVVLLFLLSGMYKDIVVIMFILWIHELGHVFFFNLFKIKIVKICFYPFGGICIIDKRLHERIYKEILCSLGGIIFQIILFIGVYGLFRNGSMYHLFVKYNTYILLFNIIPIIPLDGSKILFSIISKYVSYALSYKLSIVISTLFYIMFIIYEMIYSYDLVLSIFFIVYLIKYISNYRYVMNNYYLEILLYDHYYDSIKYLDKFREFRRDKYYYIGNVNERAYLMERFYK